MCNRWLNFPEFLKPRFTLYMKPRDSRGKTPGCNNFSNLPEREAAIFRIIKLREYFPRDSPEIWKELPLNSNYLFSSWGRIIHLKSYKGMKRELVPTIRMDKYPSVTITLAGKRKGFSLIKLVKQLFEITI